MKKTFSVVLAILALGALGMSAWRMPRRQKVY